MNLSNILYILSIFLANIKVNGALNVGTVVFSNSDLQETCWEEERLAILTSRMILEDLLPKENIKVDGNDFVNDLVAYFRDILSTVKAQVTGRNKHIILVALADLLGGYLYHFVIPKAKAAYYGGGIDFVSMEKILQLLEELKWFLRTNGEGWAQPKELELLRVISVNTQKKQENACKNLIYFEKLGNKTEKKKRDDENQNEINIPLPFFDTRNHPNAIAVPFKYYSLRNVESKRAAYVLMKFFLAATSCLEEKKANIASMKKFYNEFYTWIEEEVKPRLNDEKFYAAFGGILRIEDSLKTLGAEKIELPKIKPFANEEGLEELTYPEGATTMKTSSAVLMGILVVMFIWFLLGTMFICYRIRANKMRNRESMCTCNKKSDSTGFSGTTGTSTPSKLSNCECPLSAPCQQNTNNTNVTTNIASTKNQPRDSGSESFSSSNESGQQYMQTQTVGAAVIETKPSGMRILPSVSEVREKKSDRRPEKKISFTSSQSSSLSSSIHDDKKNTESNSKIIQSCIKYPSNGISKKLNDRTSLMQKGSTGAYKKRDVPYSSSDAESNFQKVNLTKTSVKNRKHFIETGTTDFSSDQRKNSESMGTTGYSLDVSSDSSDSSDLEDPAEWKKKIIHNSLARQAEMNRDRKFTRSNNTSDVSGDIKNGTKTLNYLKSSDNKETVKPTVYGYDFHSTESSESSARDSELGEYSEVKSSS